MVYALKQFHHYLLGRHFQLLTDHAPLQWLSALKMEGMLCRWALAMQEYDFEIVYRKGSLNTNADSLSRQVPSCATTLAMTPHPPDELRISQQADQTTSKLLAARSQSNTPPHGHEWWKEPFRRYVQL